MGGIVLYLRQPGILTAPAHEEVDLHVHQAGQQDGIPEVDDLAFGRAADADYAVALDAHDTGADEFPGVDVDETRSFEGQHPYTTGSLTISTHAAPLSRTRGCFHTSTGKLTITTDCMRCMRRLASSGMPCNGNRASR